jgi:hypothetical protein
MSLFDGLLRVFNVPPKKQENDRIIRIYDTKQTLELKQKEYMLAVENRLARARVYASKGHRKVARNELIQVKTYERNLEKVSDMLLDIETSIAAIENARLIKTMGSVVQDTLKWMQQSVAAIEKETTVDQRIQIDEMIQKIDRVQSVMTQSMSMSVETKLSPAEMQAIEEDLDDLCEPRENIYDDADESVYFDIIPTRRKESSSLLVAEDE